MAGADQTGDKTVKIKITRLQTCKRVDNFILCGYNDNRKGVTGKRFAQIE